LRGARKNLRGPPTPWPLAILRQEASQSPALRRFHRQSGSTPHDAGTARHTQFHASPVLALGRQGRCLRHHAGLFRNQNPKTQILVSKIARDTFTPPILLILRGNTDRAAASLQNPPACALGKIPIASAAPPPSPSRDFIMLGGTDLALAFNQQDTAFPLVDCAGIHVDAIARLAIS
jgi:hypothetical protein